MFFSVQFRHVHNDHQQCYERFVQRICARLVGNLCRDMRSCSMRFAQMRKVAQRGVQVSYETSVYDETYTSRKQCAKPCSRLYRRLIWDLCTSLRNIHHLCKSLGRIAHISAQVSYMSIYFAQSSSHYVVNMCCIYHWCFQTRCHFVTFWMILTRIKPDM